MPASVGGVTARGPRIVVAALAGIAALVIVGQLSPGASLVAGPVVGVGVWLLLKPRAA